jgi:hypothetical protein
VGTFRVGGDRPSIEVTSVLDAAVAASDLVVVAGPVLKLRTYGLVLAQQVVDGQMIVVVPGMTFGALELAHLLSAGGSSAAVTIVELTSLPFDMSDDEGTITLTRRRPVPAGVLPHRSTSTIERLAHYLPDLVPTPTVLHSSLADPTAAVEVPVLCLGGPAVTADERRVPPGAILLAPSTFAGLIGREHRSVIGELAAERGAVAARFGVRDLPATDAMIETVAGAVEGDAVRSVPDPAAARRLVRDGVLGSLVPLVSAAEVAGVDVPTTRAMVRLAEAILGADLTPTGRSLASIGFAGLDPNGVRARVEGAR